MDAVGENQAEINPSEAVNPILKNDIRTLLVGPAAAGLFNSINDFID
jgi:hypothetical protein